LGRPVVWRLTAPTASRNIDPTDPYVNAYLLQVDKLLDDFHNYQISARTARLGLKNAYLDYQADIDAWLESAGKSGAAA
jgi:hypothetical protein